MSCEGMKITTFWVDWVDLAACAHNPSQGLQPTAKSFHIFAKTCKKKLRLWIEYANKIEGELEREREIYSLSCIASYSKVFCAKNLA